MVTIFSEGVFHEKPSQPCRAHTPDSDSVVYRACRRHALVRAVARFKDRYLFQPHTIASVGVDVSSHQQDIDWELVAANGVEFAMIRVGYRGYTEGEIQPDDYFTQNIEGALAAGLDVGVYFFSQALDEKEAIDEANFVLESIKDYPLSYPVIFDWEDIQADARTDGMDSVQLTKNALAFCSAIEKAGYRAGVYFNQRFGYEEFDLESLQDYVFWLAEYNETPSFSYHFQLWQYCNDGRVDGIQTDVDLNLAFLRAKH